MTIKMMLAFLFLGGGTTLAADGDMGRSLFAFDQSDAAKQWQTVNDGVMGGRSDGRFEITENETLAFFGNLSLENNGGFASVRSQPRELALKSGDTILVRLRGDGRKYFFSLYVPTRRNAFSYRTELPTKKGEWIELKLPLSEFVATSFGEVVQNQPLDPTQVNGVGFLLADETAGPFKLEIDRINVESD